MPGNVLVDTKEKLMQIQGYANANSGIGMHLPSQEPIPSSYISAYAQPWYLSCSETVVKGPHTGFVAHTPSSLASSL